MSLDVVLGRFGQLVREQPERPRSATAAPPAAIELTRIRDAFSHHMVVLGLLARADGETADSEQRVILNHCLAMARAKGTPSTPEEEVYLRTYLASYAPVRMQLDPALLRLERDSQSDVAALLDAARAVVDADGERRAGEARLLTELQSALKV